MGCCCCGCKCCCLILVIVVLVIAGTLGLFTALFPYPSHASCRVQWTFGKTCTEVEYSLVQQWKAWSHEDCDTRQMCQYKYFGSDGNVISGTHTTPTLHYVDNLNFTFTTGYDGNCHVLGASESQASYAIIDFGVNYCNLRNLVYGAELNKNDRSFKENSTNAECTMYSIAHCHLYS